jgi:aldose sugar dehydrogenase
MNRAKLSLSLLLMTLPLCAQQAALGIPYAPVGDGPFVFDTAEQHKLIVTVVARGLSHPYSMAFLPGGVTLITERGGNLRIVRDGKLDPAPVPGVPAVLPARGLLDIAVHPKFAQNQFVYFIYHKVAAPAPPLQAGGPTRPQTNLTLARAKWDGKGLASLQDLFVVPATTSISGARFTFGLDGFIYMTTGAPFGNEAQDLSSLLGKVLRLTDEGKAAPGNPFETRANTRPEIFTMGHRDQLGIVTHPVTGAILAEEHGPNGGDEVNLVVPGGNYGWPNYSYGRLYDGPRISDVPVGPGVQQPLVLWLPSIGPSGMMFYNGDRFPAWKGNLFVGSVRWGEIPGTGSLQRVVLNDKLEELRREALLQDLHQRIRDVRQGPDGFVYVLTDEADGVLLKLQPTQ